MQYLFVQLWRKRDGCAPVTLLDVVIWRGQRDCAKACVDAGVKLEGDDMTLAWHKRVLRGEGVRVGYPLLDYIILNDAPSEVQIAAAAADHECLNRSWKSESSKKASSFAR